MRTGEVRRISIVSLGHSCSVGFDRRSLARETVDALLCFFPSEVVISIRVCGATKPADAP